ncbi:MAG: lysylphosphatidylglycerol synthase transmembrane domain-containing protein [archaeon]|nr:lysylphosphatidylglycerol synthase transmembrane domain-containing protein [archaeon]
MKPLTKKPKSLRKAKIFQSDKMTNQTQRKSPVKKLLSYSLLAIILLLFIRYIYGHLADFKQIALVNPLWLIPLIALFLMNYYLIGIQTNILIEPLGVKLRKMETFMLSIITGFYNLITPAKGGMLVRAAYLKKKHKFTYTNFLASLAGMYVLTFFIASLFGLLSLFFIHQTTESFNWIILSVFLGVFFPLLFIILFSPNFPETKNKFINKFIKVANGWNLIRKNKKVVSICIFVTLITLLIGAFSIIISYHIFGINISFVSALFLACIGSLSLLVQLTPGNLGVGEAIAVFSALVIGITPAQSLPVAILGRIVQMIVLFILGPIFSYKLLKHQPQLADKRKKK